MSWKEGEGKSARLPIRIFFPRSYLILPYKKTINDEKVVHIWKPFLDLVFRVRVSNTGNKSRCMLRPIFIPGKSFYCRRFEKVMRERASDDDFGRNSCQRSTFPLQLRDIWPPECVYVCTWMIFIWGGIKFECLFRFILFVKKKIVFSVLIRSVFSQ